MIRRVLLVGALVMAHTFIPAAAQAAPVQCEPEPGSMEVGESWAQRRVKAESVWHLTRGEGVTVAVIDSGVDVYHPQLRGVRQFELTGTGHRDCLGHGTAVAGIIAASNRADVPFHGVAPGVRLVSFKQTNGKNGTSALLALAIMEAAKLNVDVINVSTQAADTSDLKAAIDYALAKDIVVVAAAGNSSPEDKDKQEFPAAYAGVLSVGSVSADGGRSDFSNTVSKVGVVAPGQNVMSTWTGKSYMDGLDGTSFAAPYVAGVAALVRARFPHLTQEQVRRRIEVTADGALGDGTGAGVVNPLLAVTAVLPSEHVKLAPPLPPPLSENAVAKAPPVDWRAIGIAAGVASAALALAGALVAARLFMPMGRRRGWRASRPN
ncbi:S8 family serine peptidase [Nonomuraea roseola]|uniref:S8 family serine peptidase n=1 Tax=Nonomuraea roseola TaxID=46179 RepID=A0ABV5PQG9_9ACTN